MGLSQIPTVLLRENAHQIDNCIYGKEARHTNVCHLSCQVVHVRHLSHVVYSLTCDIYLLLFLLRFPSMPANCHFCYLLLDYELYKYSYNRIWKLFTLLQPAPVVLGLFTKRRECWGSQPLGGNGSFPWESLSRIWPLRPWMNSSECWFLEIWRAAAIAPDCLSNVEVNLELPSPLIPHLSPTGTTCWFLPIYYTSFLRSVLTYMPYHTFVLAKVIPRSGIRQFVARVWLFSEPKLKICRSIAIFMHKYDIIEIILLPLHRLFTKYSMLYYVGICKIWKHLLI